MLPFEIEGIDQESCHIQSANVYTVCYKNIQNLFFKVTDKKIIVNIQRRIHLQKSSLDVK